MFRHTLPGSPDAAPAAERWARNAISVHVSPEVAAKAAAVVRELVASAVASTTDGAAIEVNVTRLEAAVRVEVTDPAKLAQPEDGLPRLGMQLVSTMADEFGCSTRPGRHVSWATFYERTPEWDL